MVKLGRMGTIEGGERGINTVERKEEMMQQKGDGGEARQCCVGRG